MNRRDRELPPYDGGQNMVAGAVRPPRARSSSDRPLTPPFAFALEIARNPDLRDQARRAGWTNGVPAVPVDADCPISEVLRRIAYRDDHDRVLVAVKVDDGWDLVMVSRPTRAQVER